MRFQLVLGVCLAMLVVGAGSVRAQGLGTVDEGRGVWVGPMNLSPYLNASWFYDSNVDFVREGEEDLIETEKNSEGYNVQPGLSLHLPGNGWALTGDGWYQMERYDADFAENRDDWSESLSLSAETPRDLSLRLTEMVQFVSHEDVDMDRWNDRLEARVSGDVAKSLGERTRVGLGGSYSDLIYDDEDLYDWSSVGASATVSRDITERLDLTFSGGLTSQSSEDQDGNAESWTANAGFASRATEKVAFNAAAGVTSYTGFEDDESRVGLSYDLGAKWQTTERLTLSMSGTSQFQPAEDVEDNSALVSTVGVGANYRPLDRWTLFTQASYRREDYSNPVRNENMMLLDDPAGETRRDDQISGAARLVFAVTRDVSVFGGLVYSYSTSTISDFDYDRWRGSLGVALRY